MNLFVELVGDILIKIGIFFNFQFVKLKL